MDYPQPPFQHTPDYWAYNEINVEKDKLAHVFVHREAWCTPRTGPDDALNPYNVELVRAYARVALEEHGAGQWCLRFDQGSKVPTIWPCKKTRPE